MFKFIILLALIAAGGYFYLQKIEADKTNNTNSIATIKIDENSSAAAKLIKNIANDKDRYEGF